MLHLKFAILPLRTDFADMTTLSAKLEGSVFFTRYGSEHSNFLLFKTLLFPNIELGAEVDDDGRKIFLGDFN